MSAIERNCRIIIDSIALLLLRFARLLNPNADFGEKKIAYYIWHFPVLSQTFIQREIYTIKKYNIPLHIFADGYEDRELFDDIAGELYSETGYLMPIDNDRLTRYRNYFLNKKPVTFYMLLAFVFLFKYRKKKNKTDDMSLFSKAVYLAGLLKDNNINHIHSPWANLSAFICLISSILLGIRYSVQARAYDIHRKSSIYPLKPIFEYADYILTNCDYNKNYLEHFLKKSKRNKIIKIYEGVNPEKINTAKNPDNSGGQVNLLTVARITEQKGLNQLLEACKILRDRGVIFKSEIIGATVDRNYFDELMKLRDSLDLTDVVFFLGPKPFSEILEKYRHADVVVLPCIIAKDGSRDITPNTLIEASAMKIPVVSTNITGIPEIIEDGVNGLLVAPGDPYALSSAIIKLIESRDLRIQMGNSGRKKVLERFDINKNIEKFIDLFSN